MPKNVLVIDPVAIHRIRLASALEGGHYGVTGVASVEEAARFSDNPDMVIVGIVGGEAPGQAVALVTSALPRWDAPILVLDGDPTPLRRLAALRAGARDVLQRHVPDGFLLARLRGLIRDGEAEREGERRRVTAASFGFAEASPGFLANAGTVVVVNGTDAVPELPRILASTLPYEVVIKSAEDAMADDGAATDAFVLVCGHDSQSLHRLLPEFRDRSHSRYSPVMVVHPAERIDVANQALDLGASELASESATGEELGLRIEAMLVRKRQHDALRKSDEQSSRLAATDPLTGLYNRRYAEAYLGDLIARGGEAGRDFVVMLIDLDHFKRVNDRHGHPAGDQVLCEVSHRLRDNLRACDLVSRLGGEEFLVILPDTGVHEAAVTAERLRSAVATTPVPINRAESVSVTASIGVAAGRTGQWQEVRTGTFDVADTGLPVLGRLLEAADAALYRAKDDGRNRVQISV